jgi:hypothetical protein
MCVFVYLCVCVRVCLTPEKAELTLIPLPLTPLFRERFTYDIITVTF